MSLGFLNDFYSHLELDDNDRQLLKDKRGFTDETIDALGFKSCGSYIKDIFVKRFFNDLAKLRQYNIVNKFDEIQQHFLKPNILIPYFDKHRRVQTLKPHKKTLQGDHLRIYSELTFLTDDEELILTEGEFKAAAAFQYGYNCIAVPGISAFSKKNFDDLLTFLSASQVKKITVLFDKEVKDNPKYENYKKDWKNRYDTEIYSYIMAKKLETHKYDVKISEFPSDWMVDGKMDIDGCLVAGKTKDDIDEVINSGLTPKDYKAKFKRAHHKKISNYFENRLKVFFEDTPIRRSNNKYQYVKEDGVRVDISNFIMNITATYVDMNDNTLKREIVITNEDEESSRPIVLPSDVMTSRNSFKQFCYSQGNYIFKGTDNQLTQIWEWEFMSDTGKKIYEVDHVGKVDTIEFSGHDIWITKNVLFFDDKEIEPDEHGVFWVEEVGIKVKPLDEDDEETCVLPTVYSDDDIDISEIRERFVDIYGEQGKLLLGFCSFALLHKYVKSVTCCPAPFLYGEKQSGKTTICQVLMAFFGLPDFGATLTDITTPAITRLMGYYSYLPVWLDEFDNSSKTQDKERHMKAIYDKRAVMKGKRSQFGVASYRIRSQMVLSGETIPVSDGLKSRCVLLPMGVTKGRLNVEESFLWLEDNKPKLSKLMYYILSNRKELAKEFEQQVKNHYEGIIKVMQDLDVRTAKHYAYFAAGYRTVFGKDPEFLKYLTYAITGQREFVEDDEINQFFDDVLVLAQDSRVNINNFISLNSSQKEVCVWFQGLYDIWKERYSKFKEIHAGKVLMKTLTERDYYLRKERKQIGDQRKRCFIFNYSTAPESLQAIAEATMAEYDKFDLDQGVDDLTESDNVVAINQTNR